VLTEIIPMRGQLSDLIAGMRASATPHRAPDYSFTVEDVVWAIGSFCALNRKPFDPSLLLKQFPPPYNADSFIRTARAMGFRIKRRESRAMALERFNFPCLAILGTSLEPGKSIDGGVSRPAIIIKADQENAILFEAGTNTAKTVPFSEFEKRFTGTLFQLTLNSPGVGDFESETGKKAEFGYGWFIKELMKHSRIWRDVLAASLIIQLLALGTPLFTQVIIDKVVVHRTQSTLIVIAVGMVIFMVFSALLSWIRQYLVLHTGNRVDAVLGAAVFEHLLKLPPRYFEHRPTGVITARLHGVETIREFIASTAVTLVLDLPFLLIFLGIMFYYSLTLTVIALGIIGTIVLMSLVVAPVFRRQLNEQFLLGARNQAFTTEYVAGLETVKSLQMEPTLNAKYSDFLAEYLRSGFSVRQIGNTYNSVANGLEQLMTLLILVVGAYTVMNNADFTIGMLIAFQMFASRVSQPMLRMVGLWQQFQQANLSILRLGDIMSAPAEPYSLIPSRVRQVRGEIEIENLGFQYAANLPYLFQEFNLKVIPGTIVGVVGASGSGKSTLTKLLQAFYQPTAGTIKIDGNDIRNLSANELRNYFGVVPQETTLFSGSIYDNLIMANPHSTFDLVTQACKMSGIHTTIEGLPTGYQTLIGERGVGLSGGQKQRIAIARALIKDSKILIFDEATSNLDGATAEQFAATINQLRGKVTMLFISHAFPSNLLLDETIEIGERSVGLQGRKPSLAPLKEMANG
jgi:ATP-binding cassette, subfamily B, bacterial HlyB/CyaB